MFLVCRGKPQYLEKTPEHMERTCKLYAKNSLAGTWSCNLLVERQQFYQLSHPQLLFWVLNVLFTILSLTVVVISVYPSTHFLYPLFLFWGAIVYCAQYERGREYFRQVTCPSQVCKETNKHSYSHHTYTAFTPNTIWVSKTCPTLQVAHLCTLRSDVSQNCSWWTWPSCFLRLLVSPPESSVGLCLMAD